MKDEISAYGWITASLLVLAIIILLAFPFAKEMGIEVGKNIEVIEDKASVIIENIKDEDFFGKSKGYTYYSDENIIALGDRAVTVGYNNPLYVVGIYSDDHTEVILSRNGKSSDGLMKAESFMDNTTISSVVLRSGVFNVANRAFKGCTNLTDVFLSEGLLYIGYNAFESTAISSVIIPDTVTTIGSSAFANCPNLETIYIPNSVTSIGAGAFAGCSNLKSIRFESKKCPEGFSASDYPDITITFNN